MCGIIARVGRGDAVDTLITGLENLEYRGYDSAGIAVKNGKGLAVHKRSGQVSELKSVVSEKPPSGNVGIGHTRWSTHGPPTDANAHPHTNMSTDVAVVHNGVIENYGDLREWLQQKGHEFTSDTDTEVVPHLFDHYLDQGLDPESAFRHTVRDLDGSYALAAVVDGEEAVFAAREGSPLVLGIDDGEYYLASDVPAFLEETDEVVYFEDGDMAILRPDGVRMTTVTGEPVERDITTVEWDPEETGKGEYEHYMRKEIDEQPSALSNTVRGRIDEETNTPSLDVDPALFDGVEQVQFVACGTSYHAALYAETLLKEAGVRTESFRASEYLHTTVPVDDETLVVAVTQSGETADTLGALRKAQDQGARALTVTNVMGSTAARESDDAVYIRAGPEIGVAATKTFSSQVATLTMLAETVAEALPGAGSIPGRDRLFSDLRDLPDHLDAMLDDTNAGDVAHDYLGSDAFFFIGRGLGYPVAQEGALKFKEITYEHAEGFASGELKHGPLALVTGDTPLFTVFVDEDPKTLTNAKEAQARGADVVAIAPEGHAALDIADAHLEIPDVHPVCAGLLANVQLQLISYHTADELGREIDKPRNLAKSVTVE